LKFFARASALADQHRCRHPTTLPTAMPAAWRPTARCASIGRIASGSFAERFRREATA
jgi:hypothetical protein